LQTLREIIPLLPVDSSNYPSLFQADSKKSSIHSMEKVSELKLSNQSVVPCWYENSPFKQEKNHSQTEVKNSSFSSATQKQIQISNL
jgi:hypothetical protein